jgi:cephalosporin hydroxylase
MTSTVCYFKPRYIFEWGTHVGKSARIFYEISRAFKIDTQIHSIDLPDDIDHVEHPHSDRGKFVRRFKEVQLHQGDGIVKSIELYKLINTDQTILFFLDGDHSYESVNHELHTISTHTGNVVILLHDTFYQSPASNYNIGPHQAIYDFLASHPNMYNQISTTWGLPGMTLLYKQK